MAMPINFCSADGYWGIDSQNELKNYLEKVNKEALEQFLKDLIDGFPASNDLKQFILTVLAQEILQIGFENREPEWQLVMSKSVAWTDQFKSSYGLWTDKINQLEKAVRNLV